MVQTTPSHRMERITRLLQRRLAELIRREVDDPAVDIISISHVEVSRDLSSATIFITTLSDDAEIQKLNVQALNKSAAHLRRSLAKESTWRTFPALRFKYDHALVQSQHLVEILDNIAAKHAKPDEPAQ